MALSALQPWHYFHLTTQATARTNLRARMGSTYATAPDDTALDRALKRAVEYLHKRTGWFFIKRTGSLEVDGAGNDWLELPHPVISVDQGGTGISEIMISGWSEELDPQLYQVNEGAIPGPEDPRRNPWVRRAPVTAGAIIQGALWSSGTLFPRGTHNVTVTGTWGYVEEDGSTPEDILYFLAKACTIWIAKPDELEAQDDKRRGGVIMEQTRGRMIQMSDSTVSRGVMLDRELDAILVDYTRPARVVVSRGRGVS